LLQDGIFLDFQNTILGVQNGNGSQLLWCKRSPLPSLPNPLWLLLKTLSPRKHLQP
jgi:hypothetical protein